MKAIYINLDPYLAAFAAWLKAGKPGTVPSFDPLPLAVTVPLGTDVAIYIPCDSASDPGNPIIDDGDVDLSSVTVDGQTFMVGKDPGFSNIIESAISLPFSSVATSGPMYAAVRFAGASYSANIRLQGDSDANSTTIPFTVLVRRETASGPVDLVDFTPPASGTPSAADIKSALVAAGTGALAGVSLADTVLEDGKSVTGYVGEATVALGAREVGDGDTITAVLGDTTQS